MKKFFYCIVTAALLMLASLSAQAQNCRYCQTGQGASPFGHGRAECVVRIPLPAGATKIAVYLTRDGKEVLPEGEVRVADRSVGAVFVGCPYMNQADLLTICIERGGAQEKWRQWTTQKIQLMVAQRKLVWKEVF